MKRSIRALLCLLMGTLLLFAQNRQAEIKAEPDPVRRSDKALAFADSAFDTAKEFYGKGQIQKGDAQLEDMTNALNECVDSLAIARKARNYKKAEIRVAYLQRRLDGLLQDLGMQERGWAEYTQRKVGEIHDKLLEGAMRK